MQNASQRPQVVYVQRKSSGCLFWAVAVLLFGWLGVLWFAAWKLAKLAWRVGMTGWRVIWRGTVALCVWSYRGTRAAITAATPYAVRATKAFHARYGAKGWAILGGSVGAVVVVLAIIGAVTSR